MINLEKKFIALLTSMSMALTLMPMQEFGSLFTQAEEENKLIENNEIAESSVISEPYITKEIPDLRSEYSKTYEKSDGTRVSVMSSKPLHYYDTENNKWEEYDNSLTETTNAQGVDVLTNNNNDFNVEIPETLSEDTDINITTNDYEVSLQPLDVEETVVTEKETNSENKNIEEKTVEDYIKESTTSPTVAYEDAYDDATLEYEVDNTSLKETITLSQAPNDETVYQFEIKSNDLEAELEDNGSVLLKNENNTIFIIPAPFMIDSNNDFSEDIVTELTENEGSYVLSYRPSMEWLSSEERSYPVYIDPTITVSNLNSIEDAYVNSYSPNANYGHSNQLNVGRVEQNNAIAKEFFSYIKFNSLPENPWNNSYITKAELNLGVFRSGDAQINVHEVTSDWDENTITYNSRPETSDIIIDYLDTTDIDDYAQSWDITNLVEEWYDNPEENYGLMLESPNADTYPQMMYSSDYTGTTPTGNLYLTIEYASMSYTAYANSRDINVGRAGIINVNDFSGTVRLMREDLGIGGNIMPVSISLVYDENNLSLPDDLATNSYGNGFRTNYSQVITYNSEEEYYTYIGEDARPIYFEKSIDEDNNTVFVDNSESGYELSVNGSNYASYSDVTITDVSDHRYFFDNSGRLVKIADMNLSAVKEADITSTSQDSVNGIINILYIASDSSDIARITDGVGRVYDFSYDTKLTSIAYKGNNNTTLKTVNYQYNNDGTLASITYPDNKTVSYQWSNNLPTKVINTDGYNFAFTYTDENLPRVATIKEYSSQNALGEDISVSYVANKTTYTDNNTDEQEILQFDKYGNLLTSQNSKGYTLVNQYGLRDGNTQSGVPNELINSFGYQKNEVNLLENPSAFNGASNWNNVTLDSVNHLFGNQSFKLSGQSATATQSVELTGGQIYVLSAYVKTTGVTGSIGTSGATIRITNGNITSNSDAQCVSGTHSEWTRIATTFKAISDCTANVTLVLNSNNTGALAYFDGIQLEKGSTVSEYNYVVDPDFKSTVNWLSAGTLSSSYPTLNSSNGVYCFAQESTPFDNNCVKLFGDARYENSIYQIITNIDGESGDTYNFSGWAKANAAPLKDNRTFGLKIEFYNNDNIVGEAQSLSFNSYINDWQYNMSSAVASDAYNKIVISAVYDYQVNYALFDRLAVQYAGKTVEDDNSEDELSEEEDSSDENSENEPVFDSHGREIEYTDEDGVKTITAYDDYDNITRSATQINGKIMESLNGYSNDGNYQTSETNALGKTTNYNYNSQLGLLEEVTDPNGNSLDYNYNNADNISLISQDSLYNTYSYDNGDRLTQIKSCNRPAYNFSYDQFGVLTGIAFGNDDLVTYNYDDRYILTGVDYANNQSVNYSYDETGNKLGISSDDDEKYNYYYDDFGRLLSVRDNVNGIVTSFSTDSNGREYTQETKNNSLIHSYYNTDNALVEYIKSINSEKQTFYISKDSSDEPLINWNRTSWKKNGFETYYNVKDTTDEFGRLTTQKLYEANLSSDKQTESIETCDFVEKSYEYTTTNNGVNQSEQVSKITFDGTYEKELNYTYDDNGNIVNDGVYTYEYDDMNRLCQTVEIATGVVTTYYYSNGKMVYALTQEGRYSTSVSRTYSGNKMVKYNQCPITYDDLGNPLSYYNGTQFTWQMGRQLASATLSDNTQISYKYNADGIRMSKTVGNVTTSYTLIGSKITGQSDGTNNFYFRYDGSDNLVGFELNGAQYFYLTNLLGDIIAIIDSNGDCVVEYEYDPWGVCTIVSDTSNCNLGTKNPFRYRGYYYDEDISLYYLQSRYYDPVTCKFINIDEPAILFETATSLQGTLLWDYCENNPIMFVDPTGEKAKFAVLTINQFYNESKEIIKILSKVLSSNSSKLYAYKNTWEFINNWNNLNGYDVIVINSHGDPKSITYMADYNINSKKMEKIKCKLLIILGCNSGHYDYKKSNPAYCFAKRINGVVIASDGTVYSSRSYGELVFNSIADNHYLGYCKKQTRPNKGWLIYQYLNSDITVKETMYKQLQFKALIAYLKLIKKLKGI